jgi:hypothetical protein
MIRNASVKDALLSGRWRIYYLESIVKEIYLKRPKFFAVVLFGSTPSPSSVSLHIALAGSNWKKNTKRKASWSISPSSAFRHPLSQFRYRNAPVSDWVPLFRYRTDWMPGSPTFRHLKKRYTLRVHTASVGGDERDTHAVHVQTAGRKISKLIYLARP